ncbi:MAG: hypothetical protein ILP18_08310 [Treponema sp.]|nr:hypothetical protein [Treponema sp.]
MEKNNRQGAQPAQDEQMEQLSKHFNILYVLILAFSFLFASRNFFPSRTTMNEAGAFVAGALAGFVVSALVMKKGKKARITALAICIAVAAILYGAGKYWASDAHKVKEEWPVHVMGDAQFSYPGTFISKDMKGQGLPNGTVDVYSNENYKRLVCYYVYDFGSEVVDGDGLLSNNVSSMLNSLHAKDSAISKVETDGKITKVLYEYTIRGKKLTGCAGIYVDGNHAELVTFYPVGKAVSSQFIDKVYDGIMPVGK